MKAIMTAMWRGLVAGACKKGEAEGVISSLPLYILHTGNN